MKKHLLVKTNLIICFTILIGFLFTSLVSYYGSLSMLKEDVTHISDLSSESIYHNIDSVFTKPIHISQTMSADTLLREKLKTETSHLEDEAYIKDLQNYLLAYRKAYAYDSVFLVSAQTNRYYHFDGLDRILKKKDAENEWYYRFLDDDVPYAINIDNDEAKQNEITVFVNSRITDENNKTLGVVGVGFKVDHLQQMFKEYEDTYHVNVFLIDEQGTLKMSTNKNGYENESFFQIRKDSRLEEKLLSHAKEDAFWYKEQDHKGYMTYQTLDDLNWKLIVDTDTSTLDHSLHNQLMVMILIISIVIIIVLGLITYIVHRFNRQIIDLSVKSELKHRSIFRSETEKIYENIYEIDITHNCAASEATENYFKSLGVPSNTPYDQALEIIANRQIKPEYQQGYKDTFSPDNILKAYQEGRESVEYDFMISHLTSGEYYWMRITARIFYWDEDHSVRIFAYRQNIDEEKRKETYMLEKMESDSLSGLLNKAATQYHIQHVLKQNPQEMYAFFMLDVDNFKMINDVYGHAMGDEVIISVAGILRDSFGEETITGRIGGDEFVAFCRVSSYEAAKEKAKQLLLNYRNARRDDKCRYALSASIGVAVYPNDGSSFEELYRNSDQALYQVKSHGKNAYQLFRHDQ